MWINVSRVRVLYLLKFTQFTCTLKHIPLKDQNWHLFTPPLFFQCYYTFHNCFYSFVYILLLISFQWTLHQAPMYKHLWSPQRWAVYLWGVEMSSNSVNTPVIIYVASQTCIHLSIKASPTGFKNEELQIPQLHKSSCLNKLQIRRDNSSIKNEKCMHACAFFTCL